MNARDPFGEALRDGFPSSGKKWREFYNKFNSTNLRKWDRGWAYAIWQPFWKLSSQKDCSPRVLFLSKWLRISSRSKNLRFSCDRFSYSEINRVFFNTSGAKPHYSQIIKIIRTLKLVGVSDIWYRRSVFLSMKFWLWNLISRQAWITDSMLSKGKWGTSSFFRESLVISEISQNNYELVQNTWHFNNSPAKKLFLLSRNFSSRGRNTGRWCEKSEIPKFTKIPSVIDSWDQEGFMNNDVLFIVTCYIHWNNPEYTNPKKSFQWLQILH